MIIETERLTIRPFQRDDLPLIQRIYGDENLLRYTPFDTMSDDEAERHLEDSRVNRIKDGIVEVERQSDRSSIWRLKR